MSDTHLPLVIIASSYVDHLLAVFFLQHPAQSAFATRWQIWKIIDIPNVGRWLPPLPQPEVAERLHWDVAPLLCLPGPEANTPPQYLMISDHAYCTA